MDAELEAKERLNRPFDVEDVFRWLFVPLAASAPLAITIVIMVLTKQPSLPFPWNQAVMGAITAFFTVLAGALTARKGRLVAAIAVLVYGAWVAWHLVDRINPSTGEPVYAPIVATWSGGLLGFALIVWLVRPSYFRFR